MRRLETINVFDVDPEEYTEDLRTKKAVLAMRATGLFVDKDPEFEAVNDSLIELAQAIYKPPSMTYEDLVFTGVLDNGDAPIRVFSDEPGLAQSEAGFYAAHAGIEDHLYRAVAMLKSNEEQEAVDEIRLAVGEIVQLHKSLSREDFGMFRPYFVGINGYPGPSGLYSATIPTIDLLVHGGENISADQKQEIAQNLDSGLYPDHNGYSDMLRILLNSENSEIEISYATKENITKHMNGFRLVHRGSVKKFVPEALKGADGTGGVSDVKEFLDSKIVKPKEVHND